LSAVIGYLVERPSSTQACLFLSLMISMWWIEKSFSRDAVSGKWRHSSVNLTFMLTAMPIQILVMLLCMRTANWTVQNRWGLLYLLPDADTPLVKYGLMFVALDFLDYVYHLTMHQVALFWRFHRVHHTDQALDVSTTVREHPGETLIRTGFLTLWVFLCGASVEILILRQSVETVANILAHTSFRLPPRTARVFGWLFITPNLHHAHHHFRMPATNCNYGDVFSIWDRLFGTLIHLGREKIVFGLDTHMRPRTLVGHYLSPIGLSPIGSADPVLSADDTRVAR